MGSDATDETRTWHERMMVRLAKALHDVGRPSWEHEEDGKEGEPLCKDSACPCKYGFCFCPDDPGCMTLEDDGDGEHFNICLEARRALKDFVADRETI